MSTDRIIAVDGFRCVAVLSVMFYHYIYRFSPPYFFTNYYPYEFDPSILQYGFYGVQLFFVISGFVIAQTLENTSCFKEFMSKRLIRLWPTLIVCSILTFLTVKLLAQEQNSPFFQAGTINFLPSWTTIPPEFWSMLLNRSGIGYIDGAYWSLFVEMIFYIIGGLIFFLNPGNFLRNWLSITLLLTSFRIVTSPRNQFLFPESINYIFDIIYTAYLRMHFSYFVYFAMGIFFYGLYCKTKPSRAVFAMISALVAVEFYFLANDTLRILFLCIITLFVILIYKETWLDFLKIKVITWIGLVSYPLYLLHQIMGVILIDRMGHGLDPSVSKFLPFIIAIIMILISTVIYWYYERPVMAMLKRRFNFNKPLRS